MNQPIAVVPNMPLGVKDRNACVREGFVCQTNGWHIHPDPSDPHVAAMVTGDTTDLNKES